MRRDAGAEPAIRAASRHCALWIVVGFALPILKALVPMLRAIDRGGLAGLVAVSMLAGLAFSACVGAKGPAVRAAAALGLAALLFVLPPVPGKPSALASSFPYPIQQVPLHSDAVLSALAVRDGPLVEIPAGSPLGDSIAQYRAIFHGRRLLNGYGSYFPAEMPARLALIGKLPDPGALYLLWRTTGLDTMVVHAKALDPAARQAWNGALRRAHLRHGFQLTQRQGDVYVFDVVRGLPNEIGTNRPPPDGAARTPP
jgi:hypothetical protein